MAEPGTKTKKILFILPALVAGGAERVLITLMNNIDRRQYAPMILSVSAKGTLRELIAEDIPYHCLERDEIPASIPKLYAFIRKEKPDIVVSTMTHLNFALMLIRPFFRKTAFVIREAITPSYLLEKKRKISWLIRLGYMTLYPGADLALAPSKSIADEFEHKLKVWLPQLKILYNPVDIEKIRGDEKTRQTGKFDRQNTPHFIAAGRLDPQKGYDRLIRALGQIGTDFNWHLTILGEGPQRKQLERLIKENNLSDRIDMPGLSKAPWPRIAAADCLILPSRFEGMPNVVLESLACGVPVIASAEAGGVQEIETAAPEGAVKLAQNMKEFVAAMRAINPSPAAEYRPSLLPEIFHKEAIMVRFHRLLAEYAGLHGQDSE